MRIAALVLLFASPTFAQVAVRQATPQEAAEIERGKGAQAQVDVENPMLLEVPVAFKSGKNALSNAAPERELFKTRETSKYVCDRARVEEIRLTAGKLKKKTGTLPFELAITVASGWFRQDVDVTLEFLDPDGKSILRTRHWDNETIGNNVPIGYGGRTKVLKAEASTFPLSELQRLASLERPSMVRILVEIQGEEGDEDED
jgi:hypothetical protein